MDDFDLSKRISKYIVNYDYKVNDYVIWLKQEKEFNNQEESLGFIRELLSSPQLVKINYYEERFKYQVDKKELK